MKKQRACGTCRECCVVLAVPEIEKPKHQACVHLNVIQESKIGCTCYETRPKPCREFRCLWLEAEQVPADLRPDRCGVIFSVNNPPEGLKQALVVHECRPNGTKDPGVVRWTNFIAKRTAVIFKPHRDEGDGRVIGPLEDVEAYVQKIQAGEPLGKLR